VNVLRRLAPVVALFFLAPLIGEALLGSTPIDVLGTPARFPILMIVEGLLYGGGALLVREVARRTGRGWPTILTLGVAYGLVEEGLVTQSLFAPRYEGLALTASGNVLGIGWPWLEFVVTLHAVWSIGVSIGVVECLFRSRAHEPWLGRVSLPFVSILFVLGAVVIGVTNVPIRGGFEDSPIEIIGTLAVVAALVTLALAVPAAGIWRRFTIPTPPWWAVGLVALGMGSAFMAIHEFLPGSVPAVVIVLVCLVLYIATGLLVRGWSTGSTWGEAHVAAVISGGLLTYAWFGFFDIPQGNVIDLVGQIVLSNLALLTVARTLWSSLQEERLGGREPAGLLEQRAG
jgi:hypothetical protein